MRKSILLMITGLMIVSVSCRKDKNNPQPTDTNDTTATVPPDFEVSGKMYAFEPLSFTSNFKKDIQLTWRFGDGEEKTLTGTDITHTYQKAGAYSVTMLVVDSFGGSVTKDIHISNGLERMSGKYAWHFLLYRYKHGYPLDYIPNQSFSFDMTMDIANDSTINIPNVPQMPYPGPYGVVVHSVTKDALVLDSDDLQTELSYSLVDFTGGIQIIQVRNDTTWKLNGYATIIQ